MYAKTKKERNEFRIDAKGKKQGALICICKNIKMKNEK